MKLRRWLSGVGLACLLSAIIIAMLALVAPWAPPNSKECPSASEFPQAVASLVIFIRQDVAWLGCTISMHETLAGGLIAATGALFGAWLAFSAIQDQIGMAQRTEGLAQQIADDKRANAAANELDLLKKAAGFVGWLASEFPMVGDTAVAKGAFAARLLELRRTGELEPSVDAVLAPDGYGNSIKTVVGRLTTLAENLHSETKELSADLKQVILRAREAEVIDQVQALHQLSELLRSRIPLY